VVDLKKIEDKDWMDIQMALKISPNDSNVEELKNFYKKYIKPFIEDDNYEEKLCLPNYNKTKEALTPRRSLRKRKRFENDEDEVRKKRKKGEWKDVSLNSFSGPRDKKNLGDIPSTNYNNNNTFDYGYDLGKDFTLNAFKNMADEFEKRWFEWEMKEKGETIATPFQKEKEYWKIVENSEDRVTVQYGSDLDVEKHGSGFPLDPESKDPNVRQRAQHQCKKIHLNI